MQFLQAVRAIKGGVKKNNFREFLLYVSQGMDQGGRCNIENGIAVIQAREQDCGSCVDGEEWTDMPNRPDEMIGDS